MLLFTRIPYIDIPRSRIPFLPPLLFFRDFVARIGKLGRFLGREKNVRGATRTMIYSIDSVFVSGGER